MNILIEAVPTAGAFAVLPLNLGDSITFPKSGETATVTEVHKAIDGSPLYHFDQGHPAAHEFIETVTAEGRAFVTRKPGSLSEAIFGGGDWARTLSTQGLAEERAEAEANAAELDEDEEGLIELLAQEEEARSGYAFLCTYGPNDF